MDIYSTTSLNRTVQSLFRAQTALLTMFFGAVEVSDTEDIKFDVLAGRRRISPFVSPLREGKIVESLGFKTNSFTPAYVKDKRNHNPNKALKRMAGETIGGSMTPVDRRQANLNLDMADQLTMLARRKEVMAAEVLRTGKSTITGEGYPTQVVDFGRNVDHTFTLGGSVEWGDAGVDPLTNVEDWAITVLQNSGAVVTDCIMDVKAWRLFADGTRYKAALLSIRGGDVAVDQAKVGVMAKLGLQFQVKISNIAFWVYSDWYVDIDDTEKPFLPDYTVILASSQLEGVQHHGAILDEESLQPLEAFVKSWTVPDPSQRYLLMQSAPLVVPYRPDATLCATVKT